MKENELKPCPFCGNTAYDHITYCTYRHKHRHVVRCTKCNASMEYRDKESAIKAWNRRATDEKN